MSEPVHYRTCRDSVAGSTCTAACSEAGSTSTAPYMISGKSACVRPESLEIVPCPHTSPYRDVYTTATPSACSTYTTDSNCEFLCGNTEKDEQLRQNQRMKRTDSGYDIRDCGVGNCRPLCLQKYANIKSFLVCACLLSMVSGALVGGYINSVITTIEKRFEIGSSISGTMVASSEIGSLVTVIFVSYLGSQRDIPHWIGIGTVIMGFGTLFFALPHAISESYTVIGGLDTNTTEENICRASAKAKRLLLEEQMCVDHGSGNGAYVFILVMAQVMIGAGGTPLFTLGTTYVDDHVSREKSPVYIAFMFATGALGPVLGFALGALILQYYVDTFAYDVKELNLTTGDPRWVGAWWAGFIICGGLLLFLAVPFFTFPKTLHQEKAKLMNDKVENMEVLLSHKENQQRANYGRAIKDIPRSMLNILSNKVYIITSLGICCEIIIVSGFVVFVPKYLETQFGISKSIANLLTGGVAIPGAVFGILIGGYVLKRFHLNAYGAVLLTLLFNFLALFGFGFLLFLGCENPKMAGATLPYLDSSGKEIFEANLTSACNMQCACSPNDIEPICGINGITYFSPCHAGCTQFYGSEALKLLNYSGCACIMGNITQPEEVIMSPLATSGPCKSTCNNLLPFMMMVFLLTFIVAGTQMPLTMVTLRSVAQEERSFALGMQFVILRLFAYIPAPILFGNTIDTSCLLWKKKCESQGACLIYDIVTFRYKYIGISISLKIIGLLFYLLDLILIKQHTSTDLKSSLPVGEIVRSVTSINNIGLENSDNQRLERRSVAEADNRNSRQLVVTYESAI